MVRSRSAAVKHLYPLGLVVYEGPSAFDGRPVVAVATGIRNASANRKTGSMVQVWILPADRHPVEANQRGLDTAVCGGCPLKGPAGRRVCYVVLGHGPSVVWSTWKRGGYTVADPALLNRWLRERPVRLGAYGDPAAVPLAVWHTLLAAAHPAWRKLAARPGRKPWTGYTHAWRACDQRFREFLMASVETAADGRLASAAGWRTYRLRGEGQPLLPGEFECPSSAAGGYRLDCRRCGQCGGAAGRRSPSVVAHGAANFDVQRRFLALPLVGESHAEVG